MINAPSVKLFQKGVKDEESITVDEILNDDLLQAENNYVQVSATATLKRREEGERLVQNLEIQTEKNDFCAGDEF